MSTPLLRPIGALTTVEPSGCTSVKTEDGGYIDSHVHVWTPDTQRYPVAEGFATQDMIPASFMPEELFEQCRPHGVNRVVLVQMNFYEFDNRYILDMMAKHSGVFRGVAIVDETKPNVASAMKLLASQGVRGFRIYTGKEQAEEWSLSVGMKQMWSYAADAGLSICLLADPDALPAVRRMCRAYPRTCVVVDHMARIGMKGPVHESDIDNLCRLADFEHIHVKTSAFYGLGAKTAPYADLARLIYKLRDCFGATRLMWASDCPYQVQDGHTYADSIALIRYRLDFLTTEDKNWMLCKTAEKVFFS